LRTRLHLFGNDILLLLLDGRMAVLLHVIHVRQLL
jgi:hypothetical protein